MKQNRNKCPQKTTRVINIKNGERVQLSGCLVSTMHDHGWRKTTTRRQQVEVRRFPCVHCTRYVAHLRAPYNSTVQQSWTQPPMLQSRGTEELNAWLKEDGWWSEGRTQIHSTFFFDKNLATMRLPFNHLLERNRPDVPKFRTSVERTNNCTVHILIEPAFLERRMEV